MYIPAQYGDLIQIGIILMFLSFFLFSSKEKTPERKKKKRKRTPVSESSDEGSKSERYMDTVINEHHYLVMED